MYENGFFEFQTDAPFDHANAATWPTAYNQQKPVTVTYRSQEVGMFAQNDWRSAIGSGSTPACATTSI